MANIQDLKVSVERQHNCTARLAQSVSVREKFPGKTVWKGVVHVFDITAIPGPSEPMPVLTDRGQRQAAVLCGAARAAG
jgi:hypothetical protein